MIEGKPNHSDIYRALGQLEGRMDGMETLMSDGFDSLHAKIDSAFARQNDINKDFESRHRGVEKWQSEQSGGWKWTVAIGGGAAGVAGLALTVLPFLMGGL